VEEMNNGTAANTGQTAAADGQGSSAANQPQAGNERGNIGRGYEVASGGKKSGGFLKGFLKFILWLVLSLGMIFLTLFASSKLAGFDSIGDMFRFIVNS